MSSEGGLDMTAGSPPYTIQLDVWDVCSFMGEQEEHAAERRKGRDRSRQLGAPRIRSFGVHCILAGCDEVIIHQVRNVTRLGFARHEKGERKSNGHS